MQVTVQDYVPGQDVELEDPTDPFEKIEKELTNKIGEVLTLAEELAQMGKSEVDLDEFYERRGRLLDHLDGGPVWEWVTNMRKFGRVRFPQYEVQNATEETGQRESASDPAA